MAQGAITCRHHEAGECASCPWFSLPYAVQLADKQLAAQQTLSAVVSAPAWLPPVASPVTGFRNKAKMVVTGSIADPHLGLASGVDLCDCPLYLPVIRSAFPALKRFISATMLQPYDLSPASGRITPARARSRGELKNVIVTASPSGELMVNLVLRSTKDLARIESRLPQLLADLPELRVFSANIHPEHKATLIGDREIILTPQAALPMRLGDIELQLGPQSFFQTNTYIAERLYRTAASWISQNPAISAVWDLYCGVGGFALQLGAAGRRVVGIELSEQAIANARAAAAKLPLPISQSVRFVAQDATEFALTAPEPAPDLVVVNPPRRGIGPVLTHWLESSNIPHILYSSCNPVSLAADLAALSCYQVGRAQLFDMFPNTTHSEVLVELELR